MTSTSYSVRPEQELGDAPAASPANPSGTTAGTTRATWAIGLAIAVVGTALRWVAIAVLGAANQTSPGTLLNYWDAQHYLTIAAEGYADGEELAFFPGLPALMRALHLVGLSLPAAGMLVSFVALVCMATAVMALAARAGAGRAGQVATACVVTCAPLSMVFAMPYTEALFGALAFWALVALHDRAWVRAGVLVFFLGLVRLTVVDVLAVFGLWALIYGRGQPRAWISLVVSALPLAGYLAWANSRLPQGYFGLQKENWNSGFDFGAATARWVWGTLTTSNDAGYLLSTAAMVGVVVALVASCGWFHRHLPVAWWLGAALAANILLSDGLMHSRPRLLLPAALLLMPWAIAAARRRSGWVWIAAWVLFGTWTGAHMLAVFEWAI